MSSLAYYPLLNKRGLLPCCVTSPFCIVRYCPFGSYLALPAVCSPACLFPCLSHSLFHSPFRLLATAFLLHKNAKTYFHHDAAIRPLQRPKPLSVQPLKTSIPAHSTFPRLLYFPFKRPVYVSALHGHFSISQGLTGQNTASQWV